MIDFEEELKKFHPSLEVEDAEEAIYNEDLTDMADILVKMIKDVGTEALAKQAVRRDESQNPDANGSFEE